MSERESRERASDDKKDLWVRSGESVEKSRRVTHNHNHIDLYWNTTDEQLTVTVRWYALEVKRNAVLEQYTHNDNVDN